MMAPNPEDNGKPRKRWLLPQHEADLAKSGLTDDTIAAAEIASATDAAKTSQALGWEYPAKNLGACLVIPYFDASGRRIAEYVRLKPDKPRTPSDKITGKPRVAKYESPRGAANRAYFPPLPRLHNALAEPSAPLFITEGEKKALKATQDGFATIGLVGVEGWSKRREKGPDGKVKAHRELLDDLAGVPWQGRVVYIVYDSDATTKPDVRRAEYQLAQALRRAGAIVKVVRLPPGPAGEKIGLDDYLVAHTPEEFRSLLAAATDPEPPESVTPMEAHEDDDDPHRLAKLVLKEFGERDGLALLRRWCDCWLHYRDAAYRDLADKEADGIITRIIKAEFDRINLQAQRQHQRKEAERRAESDKGGKEFKPTRPPEVQHVTTKLVADVRNALASEARLSGQILPPAWLTARDGDRPVTELLVCRNGLINLPVLLGGGTDYLIECTPRFFNRNALDYDFDLGATAPCSWLTFLDELWPDDPSAIEALQEWFGLMLVADTSQQKMLLLVGPKRSGKGTIARILRGMVGPENCCGPTLASLAQNFGLQPLLGKSVAIVSDARLSGRTDQAIVIERLLSISGEDALSVPRKFKEDLNVKLVARFSILTNEIPRLADASGALIGRFIVLRLTRSFYGKEDTALTNNLLAELPGILLWAIAGWQRLRERGRFVQPESGRSLLEEAERLSSAILAFVSDRCEIHPAREVDVDVLFRAWGCWCESQGQKNVGTIQTFGRDLRAAVPTVNDRRRRDGDTRTRFYEGIGLR